MIAVVTEKFICMIRFWTRGKTLMKNLYITEKPSVADSFASVLGVEISKSDRSRGFAENDNAIISWCYGHLVTMAYPEAYDPAYKSWRVEHLPIIPQEYKYEIVNNAGAKKQFEVIKKLMKRHRGSQGYSCVRSPGPGSLLPRQRGLAVWDEFQQNLHLSLWQGVGGPAKRGQAVGHCHWQSDDLCSGVGRRS
jgi:hypothetical protein